MKHGVYAVRNILSGISSGLYLFPTDAVACVDLAVSLAPRQYSASAQKDFINSELQLFRVGSFDIETQALESCTPVLVPWDFRRMIETPMNVHSGTAQEQESQFVLDTSN